MCVVFYCISTVQLSPNSLCPQCAIRCRSFSLFLKYAHRRRAAPRGPERGRARRAQAAGRAQQRRARTSHRPLMRQNQISHLSSGLLSFDRLIRSRRTRGGRAVGVTPTRQATYPVARVVHVARYRICYLMAQKSKHECRSTRNVLYTEMHTYYVDRATMNMSLCQYIRLPLEI